MNRNPACTTDARPILKSLARAYYCSTAWAATKATLLGSHAFFHLHWI
jgi:hypothetical protein